MEAIKVGVIGTGHLGRHHARWLTRLEGVECVGVYDRDQARAQTVAGELGIRAFETLESFLEAVEACSIAASTSVHYDLAKAALLANRHCLVEKPITAKLAEAEELCQLAEERRRILTVGHIERFNPAVLALETYDLQPRFIEAHRLTAFNPRGADVAVILDLMIHDLELCLHLIPSEVVHIEASAVSVVSETADLANARLTFANGAVCNLTASRISLQAMRKLRVFQKSAYFSLDLAKRQLDVYQLSEAPEVEGQVRIPLGESGKAIVYEKPELREDDQLGAELRAFAKACREGGTPFVDARKATKALKLALEIEAIAARKL